jgi:hypothetical protein
VTPNCDDPLRRWNFHAQIGLVNDSLKLVEESPAQDAIVRVVHLHHVERQILGSGILDYSERRRENHFAKRMDDSYKGVSGGCNKSLLNPILSKASAKMISADEPLSTKSFPNI